MLLLDHLVGDGEQLVGYCQIERPSGFRLIKKSNLLGCTTGKRDYITFQRGARLITEVPPPGRG